MIAPFLCATVMAQTTADTERIELRIPTGTVLESRLTMTFDEGDPDAQMVTKDEFKTTIEVKNGEFLFHHLVTPTYLKIGAFERPMGDSKPAEVLEARSKTGAMKRYEGTVVDPEANTMIARFWTVPLPSVKPIVGNEWTFMDHREHMPYSFKGMAKREIGDRVEIDVRFAGGSGDPMKATGTALVDRKTGLPLRVELKVEKGLAPGGDGERVSVDYRFETISVKLPSL